MSNPPELPTEQMRAYEAARAQAESEYGNRQSPVRAEGPTLVVILTREVHFAYAEQARDAVRKGLWTITKAREAIEAHWPYICDYYAEREMGTAAVARRDELRHSLWVLARYPQWEQHLQEMEALSGHLGPSDIGSQDTAKPSASAERQALRDAYVAECKERGVKVTDKLIAKAASPKWSSRTQVRKWIECHPDYNGEPDRLIRAVFIRKPHLSKPA